VQSGQGPIFGVFYQAGGCSLIVEAGASPSIHAARATAHLKMLKIVEALGGENTSKLCFIKSHLLLYNI
jgi:hypothetical protein